MKETVSTEAPMVGLPGIIKDSLIHIILVGSCIHLPAPMFVFAAVTGKHFGHTNPERGVYRSLDSGKTWSQVLYVTDSTSAIDLTAHDDSGYVYAAMWEKIRYPQQPSDLGGVTSLIWRSSDNGTTWDPLNGSGGLGCRITDPLFKYWKNRTFSTSFIRPHLCKHRLRIRCLPRTVSF